MLDFIDFLGHFRKIYSRIRLVRILPNFAKFDQIRSNDQRSENFLKNKEEKFRIGNWKKLR